MEWIKIKSKEDLPKDRCDVFFIHKGKKTIELGQFHTEQFGDPYFCDDITCLCYSEISHYQVIQYPDLPNDLRDG